MRKLLTTYFSQQPEICDVVVADSVENLLHQLTYALAPQVLLLDIGLPGLDGYQVAERLRQEHSARAPWLVAITGFGADEDRNRSQAAGFARHLVKPVAPALLMQVLAEAPRAR